MSLQTLVAVAIAVLVVVAAVASDRQEELKSRSQVTECCTYAEHSF